MMVMALRFAVPSIVLVPACAGVEADVPETVALLHVRVIDGTGGPAREDQTIVIEDGRIAAIGPSAPPPCPAAHWSTRIEDIRNVEIVFKEGRALDPAGLAASAAGRVGIP